MDIVFEEPDTIKFDWCFMVSMMMKKVKYQDYMTYRMIDVKYLKHFFIFLKISVIS